MKDAEAVAHVKEFKKAPSRSPSAKKRTLAEDRVKRLSSLEGELEKKRPGGVFLASWQKRYYKFMENGFQMTWYKEKPVYNHHATMAITVVDTS